MKTPLLFILALATGISLSAQTTGKVHPSNTNTNVSLQTKRAVDENGNPSAAYKPNQSPVFKSTSNIPGVVEEQIGGTTYDVQSNASVSNRIYAYPDGTIAGIWTMGFTATAYADRGTGYNYFDGTVWGDAPTARIEPVRTGWPSYCPLGDGEVVVAHDGSTGLRVSKRPVRGTGAWTTTLLPGTLGGAGMTWPRVTSSGNVLHILVAAAGTNAGLNLPILYYRSADGGTTWEAPKILPGLDAVSVGALANTSFTGFGGDAYSWAKSKGDTVAFVIADGWRGVWVMKSFDNGVTWNQTTVSLIPTTTVTPSPTFWTNDGACAMALDSEGKAHVIFGRMGVNDDDGYSNTTSSYLPYTDGLVYWKEGMPILDTTQLSDPDLLDTNGNLLAWSIDYNGNDTIDYPEVGSGEFPFGLYNSGVTSMGQIAVDENDNIFVTYSSVREDLINTGANPNTELYRHLYLLSKMGDSAWSEPMDLTSDLEHEYDECVWASLSYNNNDKLNILYHVDPEPGTSIGSDEDDPSDNYINYLTFPTFVSAKPIDISKNVMVSPNPASDFTNVEVSLNSVQKVELGVYDVMGKLVMNTNYGQQSTGYHTFQVNTNALTNGIYLFTVKIGNSQTSQKVVVN
jgi:hypothetical protein